MSRDIAYSTDGDVLYIPSCVSVRPGDSIYIHRTPSSGLLVQVDDLLAMFDKEATP
jgi:hypothetical protein